ncbi:hypothetical protein VTH8203_03673 [Vibrio thalassae]|uniref:Uncharacterized protein n=1 Tax=Vibrio thalassae TaxID=1243014 RepID=A0A240EPU5_9VIBR|nr:hypothetical protein [Vibrio thalassae]SNX50025.1 hypothetical protein VTH8203_03673 [Vibrio thalassae]
MKRCIGLLLFFSALSNAGEFSSVVSPVDGCSGDFFTQKARIFNVVTICATSSVPQDKLKHAANVTAQWLDNDQNGQMDEPNIIEPLQNNHATLLMSQSGFSDEAFEKLEPYFSHMIGQDLSADETAPSFGRDASQEEIHHLIVNAGWQPYLPMVFSDKSAKKSDLYKQWQLAEQRGWYSYDDPTCDDACKTVEFFYLATAAYLGSSVDLKSDEMRIKSQKELKHLLPDLVSLMESERYHYPTHMWPDGQYRYPGNITLTSQVE